MGLLSNPKFIWILLLLISIPLISAQEAGDETQIVESGGRFKDLGRRSKIIVEKIKTAAVRGDDPDSIDFVLDVDSNLGTLDALFASLSMILVSESLYTSLWSAFTILLMMTMRLSVGKFITYKKAGGRLLQEHLCLSTQTAIGDETFIIAALMAMRHPKSIVLSGALSALFVMTILSTGLGRIVPNLISRKHTNSAATVLYLFFGLRLLYIAWRSSDSKASQKKEIEEVEEKLEAGQGKAAFRRFFSRFLTPIFLEAFILTFLAEWGDRSQIATIALATHKNAIGVAVGATIGHTICTSVAVIGGSMLASKISQRTVATIGGLLFLGFSLSSYFYPPL
ncbi:hypothetical protein H5410_054782 [Solanum commersonii]|uniref:GDT1 family protein n=2 Tax=Solanum TaxID=4107 RepID=A0A9J5WI41_SOLCO|nr:hypothetical protein H5410_054782 [Solanum commersonii]